MPLSADKPISPVSSVFLDQTIGKGTRSRSRSQLGIYTMASKREREDDAQSPKVKKVKGGFKVGPDNLPDGTWRRKGMQRADDIINAQTNPC